MTHLVTSTLRSSLLLCALAAGAFLSTSVATAQEQAVAHIPFAFENGSQHLPAGTYRIDLTSGSLMLLRGTVANSAGFATTIPKIAFNPPQTGKVVFHRYGDRYFISEVWFAGESTGHVFMQSRAEKQLQIAKTAPAAGNPELALNRSSR